MRHFNRRRFIAQSLTAAGSVAVAPHILKAKSPNDKIGVVIVGAGGRGSAHISYFLDNPSTEIMYIADVDEAKGNSQCDAIAKQQSFRPTFVTDMRRAYDDLAVDVMSTATPNHWHALAGIWAMQAGKDAYIEKPVCYSIAEGSALIAAARKYGRICQVGTQCRSMPALSDAIAFMQKGGIGQVNFARGLCYKRRKSIGAKGDYAIPDGIDFNLWSGPAEYTDPQVTRQRFHYDWHWQRHYGNGDLGNQGPHQTDIARWGLGIDTHPSRVISYGGRLGYQAERNDPDYVDAGDTANTEVSIYDYGDKCIVFETRGLSVDDSADDELNRLFARTKGNKIGVIFYGSDGYLANTSYSESIAYDNDFNVIQKFGGGGDHFGNFLDACSTRQYEHLAADVREGHLSAGVSHLGNISYYLGEQNKVSPDEAAAVLADVKSLDNNQETLQRTLRHLENNSVDLQKYPISMGPLLNFDPEKETFPDSPDATALLSRSYREGFVCPTADEV